MNLTRNKIMVLLDMLTEHKELESIQIGNMDIIYNPYMNDGQWEIYDHDSDHTDMVTFEYDDIIDCADTILGIIETVR